MMTEKKNVKKDRMVVFVAAALAAACAGNADEVFDGEEQGPLRVSFAPSAQKTDEGFLKTSTDFGLRIDRLQLDASNASLDIRARNGLHEEALERSGDPRELAGAELTLQGVFVEGRVFDLREDAGRLPEAGVGIKGSLPLEIVVRRELEMSQRDEVLAVDIELPAGFLDGIDFSMGRGEEPA